jgi:hypothetical protein
VYEWPAPDGTAISAWGGNLSGSASVSVVNKVLTAVDQSINTNKLTDDSVTDEKCSFTHVEATQATFSGAVEAQH